MSNTHVEALIKAKIKVEQALEELKTFQAEDDVASHLEDSLDLIKYELQSRTD